MAEQARLANNISICGQPYKDKSATPVLVRGIRQRKTGVRSQYAIVLACCLDHRGFGWYLGRMRREMLAVSTKVLPTTACPIPRPNDSALAGQY